MQSEGGELGEAGESLVRTRDGLMRSSIGTGDVVKCGISVGEPSDGVVVAIELSFSLALGLGGRGGAAHSVKVHRGSTLGTSLAAGGGRAGLPLHLLYMHSTERGSTRGVNVMRAGFATLSHRRGSLGGRSSPFRRDDPSRSRTPTPTKFGARVARIQQFYAAVTRPTCAWQGRVESVCSAVPVAPRGRARRTCEGGKKRGRTMPAQQGRHNHCPGCVADTRPFCAIGVLGDAVALQSRRVAAASRPSSLSAPSPSGSRRTREECSCAARAGCPCRRDVDISMS